MENEEIGALLQLEFPLEEMYQAWLSTDISYMEMLEYSVSDFLSELIGK